MSARRTGRRLSTSATVWLGCTRVKEPSFLPAPRFDYLAPARRGAWRSPVARLLWEQEVPGSNPGAPIRIAIPVRQFAHLGSPEIVVCRSGGVAAR